MREASNFFQSRVRTIRLLRQRSQESVAGSLGRSGAWLGLIERGKHCPPPALQEGLARELGVPVETLFPGSSEDGDTHAK